MTKRLIIAAALFLAACQPALTLDERRAMLLSERNQVYADFVRHEGECRAVAVEFPDDRKILESCLETHRFMVESSQAMIASIDKRIAEIDRTGK